MARRRRERSPSDIKLKQPDRSGPSEKTLLQLADERGLFEQAQRREEANKKKDKKIRGEKDRADEDEGEMELSPATERILETLLWSVSITMLHFTLDVLVQHQYSVNRIEWPKVWARTGQALLGRFSFLFFSFFPPFFLRTLFKLCLTLFCSLCHARLHPPSSSIQSKDLARAAGSPPARHPTGRILHHEHMCWLLSDTHHQQLWLPGCHETGSSSWVSLGVVRN